MTFKTFVLIMLALYGIASMMQSYLNSEFRDAINTLQSQCAVEPSDRKD
jgi:hypothetical protein